MRGSVYAARLEATGLRSDLRLFEPRQIRIAKGLILLTAAVTGGLHAMVLGEAWQGFALALGTTLYISLTAVVPSISRALEQDDSSHHMAITAIDLLIITAIVWVTGGVQSEYYLLYYGPVLYAALRLNVRDGIGATVLAAVLFMLVAACDTTGKFVTTTAPLHVFGVFVSAGIIAVFFALIRREAAAYESLRSYLHNSLRRVSAVYDLAHAANAGAGLSALASMLLDQAVRATGADAGVVLLLDDGGVLEISSTVGFDADWTQQLSEPATASARKALANQEAVAEDRPEMWPIPGMAKWQHVPLVAPGGPVGVLTLGSKSARKLRSSHMEFLRVLCSEAATAIENVQLRRQLDRLANTDHLTGLSNRREMERLLMIESDRAKRYQRPLAVLMIDIDNLKAVNDCYGHAVGDGVLCTLGSVLAMSIRSSDAAGRVGGDEFLVVLPETDELGAQMLAARVTETFQGEVRAMQTWKELSTPVGLSVGIAATERGGAQASQLLSAADQALYEAKRSGKNRSSVAPPERPVVFVSAGPPVIY